jgi:sensor histidine kinase YesM
MLESDTFLFNRRSVHLGFWAFVFILYTLFFAQEEQNITHVLLFVGMLLVVTMATTYFINYYLVPTYLLQNHVLPFLLYFLYTLVAALFLESIITMATYFLVANLNIRSISPAAIDVRYALAALLLIIFLGVAIKLLSHWHQSRQQYDFLLKDKIEAELRFLKTQLHPHFLFNTLNNLYYLATEKSDMTPQAILALSELLRYILNETRTLFVPLTLELNLVRNFIELEKLRFGERIHIKMDIQESCKDQVNIPPMVLLTLVENAFKHGVAKSNGQHYIFISVKCALNQVEILVENSVRENDQPEGEGVGLRNLRSQLSLLYPDRHQFSATKLHDQYVTRLSYQE